MSHARLFLSVILGTLVYLVISFVLGDRPAEPAAWVRFALMGVVFALILGTGLLLLRRVSKRID
ncbi:hypothetical protein OHA40_09565 [Nocardia sp. NBC_00508]|uniref:hypothetical protein n=1 Tax=Nocardia sp. NBC_00508 TaxID=2975992 RepID=UPI002E823B05|nr:hypothetical protein [Nocardia sp. NBC_00508]WUD68330.1 hypothetical protein OHA40_09565 [Nocardia sp. NBC_00508]